MRLLLPLLALLLIPQAGLWSAEPSKPNIVVFLADDMGWGDSATYGHELIQTPHLDKLASQGVKFTQCYSACGVCSPSRSAILTGRTPYRNGVYRHLSGNHEAHLRASEITYPKLLKTIGYETCPCWQMAFELQAASSIRRSTHSLATTGMTIGLPPTTTPVPATRTLTTSFVTASRLER